MLRTPVISAGLVVATFVAMPTLFDRMQAVDAIGPIYTARYPELATLLDDEPISAKRKEDAPVLGLGFEAIPVERIGLYEDEYRPWRDSVRVPKKR